MKIGEGVGSSRRPLWPVDRDVDVSRRNVRSLN